MKRKREKVTDIAKLHRENPNFFSELFDPSDLFSKWLKKTQFEALVSKFNKKLSRATQEAYKRAVISGETKHLFEENPQIAKFLTDNAQILQQMAKRWNKFENKKHLNSVIKRLNYDKEAYEKEGRQSIVTLIDTIIDQVSKVNLALDNKKYRKEVKNENVRINRAALEKQQQNKNYLEEFVKKLDERIEEFTVADKPDLANFYQAIKSSLTKADLNLEHSAFKALIEDLLYDPLVLAEKKIYLDRVFDNIDGMVKEFQQNGETNSAVVFLNLKDKMRIVSVDLGANEYKEKIKALLTSAIANKKYQNSVIEEMDGRIKNYQQHDDIVTLNVIENIKSRIKELNLDQKPKDYHQQVRRLIDPGYEKSYIILSHTALLDDLQAILNKVSGASRDHKMVLGLTKQLSKLKSSSGDESFVTRVQELFDTSYSNESPELKQAKKNCLQVINRFCMQKFDEIVGKNKEKIIIRNLDPTQQQLLNALSQALRGTKDSKTKEQITRLIDNVKFVDLEIPVYRQYLKEKLQQFQKESPRPVLKKFFEKDKTLPNAISSLLHEIDKKEKEQVRGYGWS